MSENNISTQNSNCEHSNIVLCNNVPCLCTNSLEQDNKEISEDVYSHSPVVENSVTVSELEIELAEDHLNNVLKRKLEDETELEENDLDSISKTDIEENDLINVSKTELKEGFSKRELEEDELNSVSKWNICMIILSVIIHTADVFSDIILAITYIRDKEVKFSFLTAGFVYFPSGVITDFSRIRSTNWNNIKPVLLYFIMFLFNLEPVLCHITIAYYIVQITETDHRENKIKLYLEMIRQQQNVARMKLLEGLFESAPQLILQIAIMYSILEKADETAKISMFQYISIITSILGLTTTIYSSLKIEFFFQETSIKISAARIILLFFWIFPIVVSRILSISFLFLKHTYYLLLGLLINCILFNICIICTDKKEESSSGMALILTFIPFSPYHVISLSLRYFICFHSVHFVGNILSCVQWMYNVKCQLNNFHIYMTIINIVSFVIGFMFGLIFIKMRRKLNIRTHLSLLQFT